MRFHRNAIDKARNRQEDGRLMGIPCARCGEYPELTAIEGKDWFAIPRIPIEIGGKTSVNCVIVCAKCYAELGQDGTKIIPYGALPHFKPQIK